MVVADVVELLGHALTAPRSVVKQSDQRLVLRQLMGQGKEMTQKCIYFKEKLASRSPESIYIFNFGISNSHGMLGLHCQLSFILENKLLYYF